MRKRIRQILTVVVMALSAIAILLMWASAYSSHIPPRETGWLNVAGLAFPVFVLANALATLACLLVRPRLVIVPLLGYLLCISDLRAYCPVNFPSAVPPGAIKVMTYNTGNFGGVVADSAAEKQLVLRNILRSGADIVCLQEAGYNGDWKETARRLDSAYAYSAVTGIDSTPTVMRCLSRYPILRTEQLVFPESNNGATAFFIEYPAGDTMVVLSNHLQSDQLSRSELRNYSAIVSGRDDNTGEARTEVMTMLRKVAAAAQKRSGQVDTVRGFVDTHRDTPMIVCGDFNDTPISYTHRKVSENLTDAYISTGTGPGFTFDSHGMRVRIDHIICPRHWDAYGAKVLHKDKGSDHYPVTAMFRLKTK